MSNFSIVPIEVAMDSRLSKNQIRVLIALLSFRKDKSTFVVWPSRREISARSGLPESRISEITTKLKELKWITKIGKGGFSKATQYKITVPDLVTVTEPVTRKEETIESLYHVHARKKYQGTRISIPEDFHVTETHRMRAKELGALPPEDHIELFIAHHQSKGTLSANWDAEFRKWMIRERVYATERAKENPAARWANKPGSKIFNFRGNYYEADRRFGQRKLSAAERQIELAREFDRLHPVSEFDVTG